MTIFDRIDDLIDREKRWNSPADVIALLAECRAAIERQRGALHRSREECGQLETALDTARADSERLRTAVRQIIDQEDIAEARAIASGALFGGTLPEAS